MSILSDKQIRNLCLPQMRVFNSEAFEQELKITPMPLGEHARRELTEQIRQKHYRPSTQEELNAFQPMIWPFIDEQVKARKKLVVDIDEDTMSVSSIDKTDSEVRLISYGLSSFGYDVRLDDTPKNGRPVFVIFSNHSSDVIDPKKLDSDRVTIPLEIKRDENGLPYVIMPAHSYGMGYTKEYFRIPRDVNVICLGKSTYARSAVFVNVTPIEAGFEGNVVIELGNHSGSPVKIYLNEGIAQFQFLQGEECEVSYADRGGKYQGQTGLQHAKV